MKKLIRKEISVNKSIVIVIIVIPLYALALIATINKMQLYLVFSSCVLMTTLFKNLSILGNKDHKVEDVLLLSLPIDRKYIVKSKYLVNGLFPLIFSILFYLFISFIRWEPLSYHREVINFDIVVISTSISLIFSGFFIPILLKWKKIIPIMYLLIIILNSRVFTLAQYIRNIELVVNYGLISIVLLFIAIVSYVISMKMSERIYKKQVTDI